MSISSFAPERDTERNLKVVNYFNEVLRSVIPLNSSILGQYFTGITVKDESIAQKLYSAIEIQQSTFLKQIMPTVIIVVVDLKKSADDKEEYVVHIFTRRKLIFQFRNENAECIINKMQYVFYENTILI